MRFFVYETVLDNRDGVYLDVGADGVCDFLILASGYGVEQWEEG